VVATAKRQTRKVLDRAFQGYVDQAVDRVAQVPGGQLPPVFREFHSTLHESRTFPLCDMPPGAETVLSVGASGLWYFEWMEKSYGHIPRHIGVEAYLPKPDALPDNVEWIEADLASEQGVAAVASGSVDLVFSGQNVEHLWPEQVTTFLVETNRVLRDGGWIVLDSPNRALTREYQWSMSEHTIEYTPDEAREILTLAGFEVTAMKGVWLCRRDGVVLPLEPEQTVESANEVLDRMMLATARPDDSFIWWAEARKVGEADVEALATTVREIFAANWIERVARLKPQEGTAVALEDGRAASRLEGYGCAAIGPWMALRNGDYEFELDVRWDHPVAAGTEIGTFELMAGEELLASETLRADGGETARKVVCALTVDRLLFAFHVRFLASGKVPVTIPLDLRMSPDPYGVSER